MNGPEGGPELQQDDGFIPAHPPGLIPRQALNQEQQPAVKQDAKQQPPPADRRIKAEHVNYQDIREVRCQM